VFFPLWLTNAGILESNAARQLLLIAVSQIIIYYVKRSKDAGKQKSERGVSLCSFKTGRRCLFHYSIAGNFMVHQDRIETNLLQLFYCTLISSKRAITHCPVYSIFLQSAIIINSCISSRTVARKSSIGLCVCAGGLDIQIWQKFHYLMVFHISI